MLGLNGCCRATQPPPPTHLAPCRVKSATPSTKQQKASPPSSNAFQTKVGRSAIGTKAAASGRTAGTWALVATFVPDLAAGMQSRDFGYKVSWCPDLPRRPPAQRCTGWVPPTADTPPRGLLPPQVALSPGLVLVSARYSALAWHSADSCSRSAGSLSEEGCGMVHAYVQRADGSWPSAPTYSMDPGGAEDGDGRGAGLAAAAGVVAIGAPGKDDAGSVGAQRHTAARDTISAPECRAAPCRAVQLCGSTVSPLAC